MTTDASPITLRGWALVLGASSGFGAATSAQPLRNLQLQIRFGF